MHCHINWLTIVGGFSRQRSEGYSSILTKRLRLVTQVAAWSLSILWIQMSQWFVNTQNCKHPSFACKRLTYTVHHIGNLLGVYYKYIRCIFNMLHIQFLPTKVQGFTSALYSQQPVGWQHRSFSTPGWWSCHWPFARPCDIPMKSSHVRYIDLPGKTVYDFHWHSLEPHPPFSKCVWSLPILDVIIRHPPLEVELQLHSGTRNLLYQCFGFISNWSFKTRRKTAPPQSLQASRDPRQWQAIWVQNASFERLSWMDDLDDELGWQRRGLSRGTSQKVHLKTGHHEGIVKWRDDTEISCSNHQD